MKKNALTTPKDKLLNLAVGAGIPFGTAASGAAGGCTGICGSCGGTCLGGLRWQPGSAAAYILSAAVKV